MKAHTQLDIGIGKRQGSYTSGEDLQHYGTSHCTKATTYIGTSIMLLVTIIDAWLGHL
jgi:hypothetical protein